MELYALFDTYETYEIEIEPGELICTSDSPEEIKAAALERFIETDGECALHVCTRIYSEKEIASVREKIQRNREE